MAKGMIRRIQNEILRAIVAHIEQRLPPALRRDYDAAVTAGMKLLWSERTFPLVEEYLQRIRKPEDVPPVVAHGIVKLVSIIQNQSGRMEVIGALGAAAFVFMAQVLEFIGARLGIPIDRAIIDETATLLQQGLLSLFRVTPEVLAELERRARSSAATAPAAPPAAAPSPAPTPGLGPAGPRGG